MSIQDDETRWSSGTYAVHCRRRGFSGRVARCRPSADLFVVPGISTPQCWVRKLTVLTSRLEFGEWPSASVIYTHALCLRLVYQLLQTPEARPLASRLPTWLTGNRSTASFIVALACPLSTRKFSVAKSWYVYCPVILLAHLLRIGCSDRLIVGHV